MPNVEVAIGPQGSYGISPDALFDLNTNKDNTAYQKHGRAPGLAKDLCTDLHKGLTSNQVEANKSTFGANTYRTAPPKSFFKIWFEAFNDPVILLLCAAAAVSTVLGAAIPEERAKNGYKEGIAIWVAILLVTGVGALNDWQKDLQFRKLNDQKDIIKVKVIRNGATILVANTEIVSGDIMLLDTGDKIIADGVVFEAHGLVIDEASLTGESDPIKKVVEDDCWCRSGTQVTEGSGKILITAVGEQSEWGKTMALVSAAGSEETPLQEKLGQVASIVGKIGGSVAAACFIALLIKWCVINRGFPINKINDNGPIQFFLYAVTIVVVAIPEGLPLAVTMALAYSMKKMMKDNNFVRVLAACETMGGATAICSDKTGTLTENRMTVTEGWFAGTKHASAPEAAQLNSTVREALEANISLNSKAFVIDKGPGVPAEFVGNRTECALLVLAGKWGCDYKVVREAHDNKIAEVYNFSSAKKMASVLVRHSPDTLRLYNKGAAEWVLQRCSTVADGSGNAVPLTQEVRDQLMAVVVEMASRGLRCICLAQTDIPAIDKARPANFFENADNVDQNMTAVAIVGIKDPVRQEVPEAVVTCQKAGIVVRMVTGDNIHTARHIARECGILTEGGLALEGPNFRTMPEHELIPLLPRLQVLARSSPEDKLTLVNLLKRQGEVVAVTGDGTNDAPALKESDVGLAMGIAGTEVAKEAADIVILDDNFSSIVKSVLWGRSVFASIRKFLQFQLTVNLVALIIAFVGAMAGGRVPLNVLQLLWVNLIMDTMGALALATEDPNKELLDDKPHGRSEPLLSITMRKHIVGMSIYQLFWLFFFMYGLPVFFPSRYGMTDMCTYYGRDNGQYCVNEAMVRFGWNTTEAAYQCNIINHCGYPCNFDSRDTPKCPLAAKWTGFTIPTDAVKAMCATPGNTTWAECDSYWRHKQLDEAMWRKLDSQQDEDFKNPASVLFNSFIFAQLGNLLNARRINNEYNIFAGLSPTKSPVFLAILFIIMALQVAIVHGVYSIFRIRPLDGYEWLVSLAVGAGAIPWSTMVRFLDRNVFPKLAEVEFRRRKTARKGSAEEAARRRSMSGRTLSGRSNGSGGAGGRTASGRTASGKARKASNEIHPAESMSGAWLIEEKGKGVGAV